MFYSNLPRAERPKLGARWDGLVIRCTYRGIRCNENHFRHFLHPTLINCYTFNPQLVLDSVKANSTDTTFNTDDILIGPQSGLSLILRSEPNPNYMYEPLSNMGNVDSIRVAIHSPGSVPFLMNKGVNLKPGQSTSISLMMQTYDRLGSPYKACHKKETFEIDSREFMETSDTCREKCIVDTIRAKCNCTSTFFEDLSITDHDYCLNLHEDAGPGELNKRSLCESDFIKFLPNLDCSHCIWDCNEMGYDTQIAFADWPHSNKVEDFVWNYLLGEIPCDGTLMQYYTALQKATGLDPKPCNNTERVTSEKEAFSMVTFSNTMKSWEDLFTLARDDFAETHHYEMGVPWIYTENADDISDDAKLQVIWVKNSFYRLNVYFRQSSVEQHTQVSLY